MASPEIDMRLTRDNNGPHKVAVVTAFYRFDDGTSYCSPAECTCRAGFTKGMLLLRLSAQYTIS